VRRLTQRQVDEAEEMRMTLDWCAREKGCVDYKNYLANGRSVADMKGAILLGIRRLRRALRYLEKSTRP
jgi:hypothetical protein